MSAELRCLAVTLCCPCLCYVLYAEQQDEIRRVRLKAYLTRPRPRPEFDADAEFQAADQLAIELFGRGRSHQTRDLGQAALVELSRLYCQLAPAEAQLGEFARLVKAGNLEANLVQSGLRIRQLLEHVKKVPEQLTFRLCGLLLVTLAPTERTSYAQYLTTTYPELFGPAKMATILSYLRANSTESSWTTASGLELWDTVVTAIANPEQSFARTAGVPEQSFARTAGVPEQSFARTAGVPEQSSARTAGVPEQSSARTAGVPEQSSARTAGEPSSSRPEDKAVTQV
jgi:hypothetical protein